MRTLALVLLVALTLAACDEAATLPTPTPPPPGASPGASGDATTPPVVDPIVEQLSGAWRRFGIVASPAVAAAVGAACRGAAPAGADPAAVPVVVDARGLGRASALLAGPQGWWLCLATLDGEAVSGVSALASGSLDPASPGPEAILILDVRGVQDADGTIRTIAIGRVGSDAAKVRAAFNDETYVTATSRSGWWAMWWPGTVVPPVIGALDKYDVSIGSANP